MDNNNKKPNNSNVVGVPKKGRTKSGAVDDNDDDNDDKKNSSIDISVNNSRGSGTDDSNSGNNNNSEPRFTKGDTVSVYLSSGRKSKGTISAERSRGRYDVTLDSGDVEKRVGAEALSPLPHRRNKRHNNNNTSSRRRSSDHSSIQSQKSVVRTGGRRESRDRNASDHTPESDDRNRDTRRTRRRSSPSTPLTGSPSSNKQATGTRRATTEGRSVSPSSSKASYSGSAISGRGGEPGQQPPNATRSSSSQAVTRDEAPASVASESEADNNGADNASITSGGRTERALSSERASGSSPLAGKVRQAGGLLKTVRRWLCCWLTMRFVVAAAACCKRTQVAEFSGSDEGLRAAIRGPTRRCLCSYNIIRVDSMWVHIGC